MAVAMAMAMAKAMAMATAMAIASESQPCWLQHKLGILDLYKEIKQDAIVGCAAKWQLIS